jgi:hypothetical protein
VSSEKDGGAGARGIRYAGSLAGMRGDGYDVRLDAEGVSTGLMEEAEGGRDGNNCERRSEPDVFFRMRGGREKLEAPPATVGEPARRAVGTLSPEAFLAMAGEPTRSGEGTPSMAVEYRELEVEQRRLGLFAWCRAGRPLVQGCRAACG